MQTAISKLTKKYQATVPEPVRKKLNLNAGDVIAFEIEDDMIKLRKARPIDIEFSNALIPTLSEWESQNDEEVCIPRKTDAESRVIRMVIPF